jgi:hypothetical protein
VFSDLLDGMLVHLVGVGVCVLTEAVLPGAGGGGRASGGGGGRGGGRSGSHAFKDKHKAALGNHHRKDRAASKMSAANRGF